MRDTTSMLAAGLLATGVACASAGTLMFHQQRSAPREASVADIVLTDQDGVPRTLAAWSGRTIVLDFIFTGCGDTCPLKTAQLAEIQQDLAPELRARVQFISVSIDPEHDSPAALKAYAARNGAVLSGWTFLTGDLGTVARFAAAFDPGPIAGEDAPSHITTIRVLDPSGHVWDRYAADPVETGRLLHDIAALARTPSLQPSPSAGRPDRAPPTKAPT